MDELAKYIAGEWGVLSAAPLTFALTLVLAIAVAFAGVRWGYERIVSELREQSNTLRERLAAKDEILASYRSRLEIAKEEHAVTGSALSKLSNPDLRARALALTQLLREFIHLHKSRDYQRSDERMMRVRLATTEEEKSRLWNEENIKDSQHSLMTGSEYDTRFRVEAILLRDELLSRVPESIRHLRKEHTDPMYEHPTNYFGYTEVADDIEMLAKTL